MVHMGRSANVAVEFAITLPVLLLIIFGVMEFGRAYWIQNTLQFAAEQSGRCIMTNTGQDPTSSSSPCYVGNFTSGLPTDTPTSGICPSTSPPTGSCPTTSITTATFRWIAVTYDFSFVTGLPGLTSLFGGDLPDNITLRGQSVVPVS